MPPFHGSYRPEQVTFLLKPIELAPITDTAAKEALIQSGQKHYSEMLSPEYPPSAAYLALFAEACAQNDARLAADCLRLAALIAGRRRWSRSPVLARRLASSCATSSPATTARPSPTTAFPSSATAALTKTRCATSSPVMRIQASFSSTAGRPKVSSHANLPAPSLPTTARNKPRLTPASTSSPTFPAPPPAPRAARITSSPPPC